MGDPVPVQGPARRGRRTEILEAAAVLFAQRGFHGVAIDDIGRAIGVSGPALYRHFRGKEAVLAQMLLDISERLRSEGERRVAAAEGPEQALAALIDGHIAFALGRPALITVHDRELGNVPEPERRQIRRLQRRYVEQWVAVLSRLRPEAGEARLRAAVHAALGLLNSTPHSAGGLPGEEMRAMLAAMARAALLAG
ncbi:TetR/AcrR family transcriptional regulator [Allonocardiopsis opalescens]|nr:TetR/AcrR family transcriptional regulator [Allonocardiopsis opalescens]